LPYLRLKLAQAPEPLLRALFEATRLTIDLHEHSNDATITVTLPADDLPAIADAAEKLPVEHPTRGADQREPADRLFVDAVGAPGEARTASTNISARSELMISSRVAVPRRRRRARVS
jgi:hypothetical protein